MNGRRFMAAASQHPDGGHAAAELVGAVGDRLDVAPSLVLMITSGVHCDHGRRPGPLGPTVHHLLQAEQTIVVTGAGAAAGARLLDPAHSTALLAMSEVDVAVEPSMEITPDGNDGTVGSPTGSLTLSTIGDDGAARIDAQSAAGAGVLHLSGDSGRRRSGRVTVTVSGTMSGLSALLTTSAGAVPVGMPVTVTAADVHRVVRVDDRPARSFARDHLQLDDTSLLGSAPDLPLLGFLPVAESGRFVAVDESDRIVPVVGSDQLDGSLLTASPVIAGTVVQLVRHDPDEAVRTVIDRQLAANTPAAGAALLTSSLSSDAGERLPGRVVDALDQDVFGVIEPPPAPFVGRWPGASILTLG